MTDSETDLWRHDDLHVDDLGPVVGSAYTRTFHGGHDVTVSVTSYEYERDGETRWNHVPHVVVSDGDGAIVAEPEARDSSIAERAITNAKGLTREIVDHPERYID